MKKIKIGIVPRTMIGNDNNPFEEKSIFQNRYAKKIIEYGGIPIGLIGCDGVLSEEQLNLCDGFLFPGGSRIEIGHYQILMHAIYHNKPVLGICLGMQAMALYDALLSYDENITLDTLPQVYQSFKEQQMSPLVSLPRPNIHGEKIMHDEIEINLDTVMQSTHSIQIQKNSCLYAIYQKEQKEVISLHSYCVNHVGTQFVITAKAQDGVIEAIEYNQNGFFIVGVQYHPEFEKNDCLFEQLLTECQKRK